MKIGYARVSTEEKRMDMNNDPNTKAGSASRYREK